MNGVLQIEMRGNRSKIICIMIEVMAVCYLARAAVAAAVVRNHAITVTEKEQHLVIPVISGKRPAMAEYNRLTLAPVLVEDFNAVLRFNKTHVTLRDAIFRLQIARYWLLGMGTTGRKLATAISPIATKI